MNHERTIHTEIEQDNARKMFGETYERTNENPCRLWRKALATGKKFCDVHLLFLFKSHGYSKYLENQEHTNLMMFACHGFI